MCVLPWHDWDMQSRLSVLPCITLLQRMPFPFTASPVFFRWSTFGTLTRPFVDIFRENYIFSLACFFIAGRFVYFCLIIVQIYCTCVLGSSSLSSFLSPSLSFLRSIPYLVISPQLL